MGLQERIKEIEFEMGRTQKNKATEGVCTKIEVLTSQPFALTVLT